MIKTGLSRSKRYVGSASLQWKESRAPLDMLAFHISSILVFINHTIYCGKMQCTFVKIYNARFNISSNSHHKIYNTDNEEEEEEIDEFQRERTAKPCSRVQRPLHFHSISN